VSATGLKRLTDMNKIYSILKIHSLKILIPLFISTLVLWLLNFELSQIIAVLILIAVILYLILIITDSYREEQIAKIRDTIRDIRHNKLTSADQINLGSDLARTEREIKKMFDRMENDISNLKKLEKVRTQFLGNVSHELRTPIFAIQGYLETLVNGAINDSNVNMKFLQKAFTHTNNLNNLLNDLIDISMIESGEMKMNYGYFEIVPFLEKIVSEFRDEAREKNIDLKINFPDQKIKYYCDKDKLRQVMVNLISNSIKYTEKGYVLIELEDEDKYGKITVRDSGIGIPENDIERIFERFYRVDKDRSRAVGGTGLGLAIVKHIVTAHGSKVTVKSELGEGSSFSFKLKKQILS
jgi:two-component system phosphate regulon sensor histidine kinase PhoR